MGARDHACETCGRGGMNDDRPCICGKVITAAEALQIAGDLADHHCGLCPTQDVRKLAAWVEALLERALAPGGHGLDLAGLRDVDEVSKLVWPWPVDKLRTLAATLLVRADEANAEKRAKAADRG